LQEIPADTTPPEVAYHVHRIVRKTVAADDPYQQAKAESTAEALALYPKLKRLVAESADPLDTAIRISIAGNIIDFGATEEIADLWQVVESILEQPYAIDHCVQLRERLDSVDRVLYLGDNAGETVFDRVLIETLSVPVSYVAKGRPILNDATIADAVAAGLDQCAALLDNGSDAPGTVFPLCSDAFRNEYESAPLVIAKGQANYESLSEAGDKVFCLLRIKCPVIAEDIGQPVNGIVVQQSS
jgi:damage-control phosphatase, subfamily I